MSTTIDQRVVEMQFDNRQFERNINTSISSLDRLKQNLNLSGCAKGLENINYEVDRCNVSGLSRAVDEVTARFSALEIMAVTALVNITNSAVNAGKKLVSSLTIDQISAGFDKYANKTSAVQTIMAATAKNFTDTGKQMEYVNDQLGKLNWFTDETSYNFVDMVSNIGKFTSNNIALDKSVTAMQGIASWAAISGANASEASRAMYNLSQAISTGSVKLIDWKSIENANMATAGFKETALETAVALGTLKKSGDGLYKTLKGNEVSISNFNSELSEGWFTSEVLLTTLDKYGGFSDKLYEATEKTGLSTTKLLGYVEDFKEGTLDISKVSNKTGVSVEELTDIFEELGSDAFDLGRRAFRAAQEAKTFREAIDSVKDAVSTGWMTTYENIFGDYEEAKELWTDLANELYDVFAEGGNARNELLEEWKELGGRTDLIDAFWNLFNGLRGLAEPVKEAFRDIFPETNAQQLVEFTKKLKELTEKFKLSDETANNLKRTFKGIFALLDIGKQAITALAKGFFSLLGITKPIGQSFLGFTASIGDFIVKMDEAVKSSGIFNSIVSGIIAGINGAINAIKNFANQISSLFNKSKKIDTTSIDEFSDKVEKSTEPIKSFGDILNKTFEGIKKVIDKISPVVLGFVDLVKKAFSKVKTELSKSFQDFGVKDGLDILNAGFFGALLLALKKFIDSLSNITKNAGGFLEGITGILDGVRGSLEAFQSSLKAKTLMTIATAIAVLAASLLVLSLIDSNKLIAALSAMTVIFIELFGSIAGLSMIMGKEGFKGLTKIAASMVIMSISILILSSALKSLAELEWKQIGAGLLGISGLIAILIITIKTLSSMNGQLVKGLVGLIALSGAIIILTKAVGSFSKMKPEEIKQGLTSVGLALAAFATFINLTKNAKGVISTAFGITILSASLLILGKAIKNIGSLDNETWAKGLVGIGAALLLLTATLNSMVNATKGALALLVISASLIVFAQAMKMIGSMSIAEIVTALGTLLVAIGGLAILTSIISPIIPLILALAASLALLGVASLAIGAGILLLSTGMAALAVSGTAGAAALVLALTGIIMLIPVFMKQLGLGLVEFINVIANSGDAIFKGFKTVLTSFIDAVVETTPLIVEAIFELLSKILKTVAERTPELIQTGFDIIKGFLKGIRDNIKEVVVTAAEIIIEFIKGISEKLPEIIDAGFKLIISFMNGLSQAIDENSDEMIEAGTNLAKSIINGIIKGLKALGKNAVDTIKKVGTSLIDGIKNIFGIVGDTASKFVDIGKNIVEGLINGLKSKIQSLKDAAVNIGSNILESVKGFFKIESPSKVMRDEVGKYIVQGIAEGIKKDMSAEDAATKKAQNIVSAFKTELDKFSLDATTADLEYQLWSELNSSTATASQKTSAELDLLNKKIKFQNEKLQLAQGEYQVTLEELGADSEKTQEAYNKYLNEQINLAKLTNELAEREKAANENQKYAKQAYYDYIRENQKLIGTLGLTYDDIHQTAVAVSGYDPTKLTQSMSEDVKSATTTAMSTVQSVYAETSEETFGGLTNNFSEWGSTYATAISDAMKEETPLVVSTTATMLNSCLDKMREYYSKWKEVGAFVVEGFIKGIEENIDNAKNAAAELARVTLDSAKDELEVNSPSKKFIELGMYVDRGFAIGIEKYSSVASEAADDMGNNAIENLKNSIKKIAYINASEINSNPVIRPVIDLTDIKEGEKQLNDIFGKTRNLSVDAGIKNASNISKDSSSINVTDSNTKSEPSFSFVQNNYSPTALSRIDIYRQTKNQFSALKGLVSK